MCGIAGFVASSGRGQSSKTPAVLRSIEHRGPDDGGWLRTTGRRVERGREWRGSDAEPEVLLLHRRLSILDTTDSGWQPMSTADDRYHLVFNGEIYNYIEIRRELETLGHRFHSNSDTEVLLTALAQWGTEALQRFVGMFALALLDTHRRTLLLARDFFGIKPLYYWQNDGCLYFASEIKALNEFGLTHPRANTERLLLYLRYGVTDSGDETMLSEVRQVPAAHLMEISLDDCSTVPHARRYWSAESDDVLDISFEEAAERVRELFLNNVRLHLRSDVPLGLALSGGLDSSSILMCIRHLDPQAEIHAFSYISEDRQLSEEKWVDIVGASAGAHIHKISATVGELKHDIDEIVRLHDEPFGSTSVYAQYRVFREAHKVGVKVMLDGQGADEILGGYDHYRGARLASLVRQGRLVQAAQFLRSQSRSGGLGVYRSIAYCGDYLLPPALQTIARSIIGKEAFPAWLNRRWFSQRGHGAVFGNYTSSPHVLRASLSRSVWATLPALLRYEDRNSMVSSVESRVPFLTPDLARFLGTLPESYLIDSEGTTKSVFRKAMRGIVPDAILDRRDKVGFVTPERRWLNELDEWVRMALDSEVAATLPFMDLTCAKKEFEAVRTGRKPFGFHIWRWVNLIRWTERMNVRYD